MANIYWCIFCNFGVYSLRSQFGNMAPPNRPEITMDPSVLEDFFAFQAYKTARDALEVASAVTGPGGGGEVVLTTKVTSAPKKKNPLPHKLPKRYAKSKMLVGKGKKEHGSPHTHMVRRAGCSPPAGNGPQGWVCVGQAHVCFG
jgi:hypothetical protein